MYVIVKTSKRGRHVWCADKSIGYYWGEPGNKSDQEYIVKFRTKREAERFTKLAGGEVEAA